MENPKGANNMFFVGAQSSADGDMLPGSFTVFYNSVPLEAALEIILEKISNELQGLGIENADGTVTLLGIETWQEFADISLDDQVKLTALVEAVTSSAIIVVHDVREELSDALNMRWSRSK